MHETDLAPRIDEILPNAKDFMKKLAVREAAEASKQATNSKHAAAEQKSLLEQLKKPSGISDDEAVRRGVWLEINASPERLDLNGALVRSAKAKGALGGYMASERTKQFTDGSGHHDCEQRSGRA